MWAGESIHPEYIEITKQQRNETNKSRKRLFWFWLYLFRLFTAFTRLRRRIDAFHCIAARRITIDGSDFICLRSIELFQCFYNIKVAVVVRCVHRFTMKNVVVCYWHCWRCVHRKVTEKIQNQNIPIRKHMRSTLIANSNIISLLSYINTHHR